jgi:outer membrane protein assembly factor BamD
MLKFSRVATALVACAIILPVTGCATNRAKSDVNYVASDVNTLYGVAKERLDRGEYEDAAKLFDEVERQHPYSVWARRAQLMSSFSYYMAQKYPDAVSSSQRFLTIHPGNKDAPYASYLIAMSYYNQIADVSRDQKVTGQALDSFNELIRRYPESRYASDARLKLDLINDHLAGKEMEVGRFYQRSGNWLASVQRFRSVVDKYQTTSHTPEALMRLTESYLALGIPTEAEKSAAILGRNYPGSDWYKHAFDLIQRKAPRRAAVASRS